MKKTFLILLLALFLVAGTTNAQVNNLPNAGLTPESTFYFLDRLGENLQEFFTFNKESKARLQIEFVNERIAEIKLLVETKGPETKGIEKAKTLLLGNVAHAAEIVQEVKSSGKEVSALAKELDDEFDRQEQLLVKTFQDAQRKLKEDRLANVQKLIEEAQKLGDTEQVVGLKAQAEELVLGIATLKGVRNEIKESFRSEKRKIEEELNDEDQKEDKQDELDNDEDEEIEDSDIDDESEEVEIEDEDSDENENDEHDAIRENAKQVGKNAREEAKQKAEESDEDNE